MQKKDKIPRELWVKAKMAQVSNDDKIKDTDGEDINMDDGLEKGRGKSVMRHGIQRTVQPMQVAHCLLQMCIGKQASLGAK